jgi:hypothetical protein
VSKNDDDDMRATSKKDLEKQVIELYNQLGDDIERFASKDHENRFSPAVGVMALLGHVDAFISMVVEKGSDDDIDLISYTMVNFVNIERTKLIDAIDKKSRR